MITTSLTRLKNWLNQPYPYVYNIPKLIKKNVKIGAFIGLFLFVFKPFGIFSFNNLEQIELCIGFGLITFFINTVFEIAILSIREKYLKSESWTTKNAIIKITISIILISFGNTLFLITLYTKASFIVVYLEMLASTFILGSLPASFFLNFQQLEYLKGNEKKIVELNRQLEQVNSKIETHKLIQIPNENGEIELQLHLDKIIYVKSESNYLEIHVDDTQSSERYLLRNRIKNIEQLLPANFIRCHRSYIVNRNKIKKVEGSTRGYQLLLYGTTDQVPVSRSQTKKFSQLIEQQ